jgi:hypothetical protein
LEDAKLLQMGWVYDVNFRATLRRLKERRYMELLAEMLPKIPQVSAVCNSIITFVNDHVGRDGSEVREKSNHSSTPEPALV